MTNSQYERAIQIARDNAVIGEMMTRFVRFLVEWSELRGTDWTKDPYYASEWAKRFMKRVEYLDASGDALIALVHVDGEKQAIERYAKELADYNGITIEKARPEVKRHLAHAYESEKHAVPETFKGYNVAKTKPKNKCICKSAGIMIGKLPNFEKNFNKIMK